MERWILAFWLFFGGVGLYHASHRSPAASSGATLHVMDGGVIPPSRH